MNEQQEVTEVPDEVLDNLINQPTQDEVGTSDEQIVKTESNEFQEKDILKTEDGSINRLKLLEEENQKLKKTVEDQQKWEAKRSTEIGELRKKIQEKKEKISDDNFFDSPVDTVKSAVELKSLEDALEQAEKNALISENKAKVDSFIPDLMEYVEDIAKMAEKEGYPNEIVQSFKINPYLTEATILKGYVERAKAQREMDKLRQEIEELKKKPDAVLKNIDKVAKNASFIKANASGIENFTGIEGISISDITNLSEEQLDRLIEAGRE